MRPLRDLVEREAIECDYLLIPGDITEGGKIDEFERAADALEALCEALSVPLDRVIFVPGNHDCDYDHGADGYHGFEATGMFRGLLRRGHEELITAPFLRIWERDDILVCAFNSAWDDKVDTDPHHGRVTMAQVSEVRRIVAPRPTGNVQLRIFLLHHHVTDYRRLWPNRDPSQLDRAPELLAAVDQLGFDLVVHGHRHMPGYDLVMPNINRMLPILCAGTFSRNVEAELVGAVNNQFHCVEFISRSRNGTAEGMIRSWSYHALKGWRPSLKDSDGILPLIPFGDWVHPQQVAEDARAFVLERLNHKSWMRWREAVEWRQDLGSLPPEVVLDAMRLLGEDLGAQLSGSADDLMDLVLLRE